LEGIGKAGKMMLHIRYILVIYLFFYIRRQGDPRDDQGRGRSSRSGFHAAAAAAAAAAAGAAAGAGGARRGGGGAAGAGGAQVETHIPVKLGGDPRALNNRSCRR